jgi:hypothetical protein
MPFHRVACWDMSGTEVTVLDELSITSYLVLRKDIQFMVKTWGKRKTPK